MTVNTNTRNVNSIAPQSVEHSQGTTAYDAITQARSAQWDKASNVMQQRTSPDMNVPNRPLSFLTHEPQGQVARHQLQIHVFAHQHRHSVVNIVPQNVLSSRMDRARKHNYLRLRGQHMRWRGTVEMASTTKHTQIHQLEPMLGQQACQGTQN